MQADAGGRAKQETPNTTTIAILEINNHIIKHKNMTRTIITNI